MNKILAVFILALAVILLSSCISPGMSSFYEQWLSPEFVTDDCLLKEGKEPKVYYSSDPDSDIYYLRSNYYWILGSSSYNGPAEDDLAKQVKRLCEQKGAEIGLYTYHYTDTRSGVYTIGKNINSYSIKRYDYDIYLFIPMPDDLVVYYMRIGLAYRDLESSERLAQHRNTGACITTVFEGTPAYYANLSHGDIIIAIDGQDVPDARALDSLLDKCDSENDIMITYIRNGAENTVSLRPLF